MSTRAERKARTQRRRCRNCGEYKIAHFDPWTKTYICAMSGLAVPEEGEFNEVIGGHVVRVTENWVVAVVPMIFNDRIILCRLQDWSTEWVAGFCYDKGGAAALAALVWNPETEQYPVGFKKLAVDGR